MNSSSMISPFCAALLCSFDDYIVAHKIYAVVPPALVACRYEVNPEKIDEIEAGGLEFVGRDESGLRMEIAEIPRKICSRVLSVRVLLKREPAARKRTLSVLFWRLSRGADSWWWWRRRP